MASERKDNITGIMVPPVITQKLSALRGREKFQSFAWGICRVLAVALVVLLLACLTDWLIDRTRDVPLWLRVSLLTFQIVLALGLFAWLVLPPILRRLSDDRLALWIEDKHPRLKQRLISAVQLNRRGADRQGMSSELIAVLTREAEQETPRLELSRVVDNRRLFWGIATLAPVLILFAVPFLVWPNVFPTLLARQFLADSEIPRSVALQTPDAIVWPKGETLQVAIVAKGPGVPETADGEVEIRWKRDDLSPRRLSLRRVQDTGEQAIYIADVTEPPDDFTYTAWIGDGRMRQPAEVRFVPRPEVRETAFVQLPEFCGRTPFGTRYERPAGGGDAEGIPGSALRVQIDVQKPVENATLRLFAQLDAGLDKKGNRILMEVPAGEIPIPLDKTKRRGSVEFDLGANSRYTIEVEDEYGFKNQPQPSRNVRIIPEPPPEVALLPEQFPGKGIDPKYSHLYVHAGMPALEGTVIRVGYKAFGQYGLGKVKLEYRRLREFRSEDDTPERPVLSAIAGNAAMAAPRAPEEAGEEGFFVLMHEEPRVVTLKVKDKEGYAKVDYDRGPFQIDLGVFERTPVDESVGFHAVESPDPLFVIGRMAGGGRYDLQLGGLLTSTGAKLKLKKGDKIEYWVVVYSLSGSQMARSESRITSIEDWRGFSAWMDANREEQDRIRRLEEAQRTVFEKGK